MLDNFRLLVIPFVSVKKYNEIINFGKTEAKYSYEGQIFYLINKKGEVVYDATKFISFEYRPFDDSMLHSKKKKKLGKDEPTDCYLDLLNQGFDRKSVFPTSKNNVVLANSDQITNVNSFIFRKMDTALNAEKVITGSNPTGSESEFKKSPFLIKPNIHSKENNKYIYFINAIKRIRIRDSNIRKEIRNKFSSLDQLKSYFKIISINQLLEENNIFKNSLELVNNIYSEKNTKEELSYIEDLKKENHNFDNEVKKLILEFNEKLITSKTLIRKLRNIFRQRLLLEAKEKGFKEFCNDKNIELYDTQASHIISVSKIKNSKNPNYYLISDKDNGLLLSPNHHSLFDKNRITFNKNGNLIILDENYDRLKLELDTKVLNGERSKNLEERNMKIFIND